MLMACMAVSCGFCCLDLDMNGDVKMFLVPAQVQLYFDFVSLFEGVLQSLQPDSGAEGLQGDFRVWCDG